MAIEAVYVDPFQLREWTREGFPDGDCVIAVDDTIEEGADAGTLADESGSFSTRDLSMQLGDHCVIVRAAGSDAMLPDARTIDGEDLPDGTINRLQQLAELDGVLALADPESCIEGIEANQILWRQGFYSEQGGEGGYYDDGIVSKLRMYADQDAAMAAVVSGRCQLGFAIRSHLASRYTQVEECYNPSGNLRGYTGFTIAGSPEPEVAKDFFEFVTKCS